jgi:hypothetical protein
MDPAVGASNTLLGKRDLASCVRFLASARNDNFRRDALYLVPSVATNLPI